jgi:hypothetical protein
VFAEVKITLLPKLMAIFNVSRPEITVGSNGKNPVKALDQPFVVFGPVV